MKCIIYLLPKNYLYLGGNMKKGVLFLVFAMIFTMIVPAQAMEQPQNIMPDITLSDDDINGKYVVSVKSGDNWNEIGSLKFGKNPNKQTLNIGSYLDSDNTVIKLSQYGGGAAFLDAVLLDNAPAVKVIDNTEKVLNKLSKEDLDITPVGEEGVVIEFSKTNSSGILAVVGRIEKTVIGKEPFQFPRENTFKPIDEITEFYKYSLGSNYENIVVDGEIDEISMMTPFKQEYCETGSGHPNGYAYFWVMNDNENLYVTLDATPDNTYDLDKDYAKVIINTEDGKKEFKISVPETTWGSSGFTYTDKVKYEHKVYEFAIPFNTIGINNITYEEIDIAFAFYGTAYQNYLNLDSYEYQVQVGSEFSPTVTLYYEGDENHDSEFIDVTNYVSYEFLGLTDNVDNIISFNSGKIKALNLGVVDMEVRLTSLPDNYNYISLYSVGPCHTRIEIGDLKFTEEYYELSPGETLSDILFFGSWDIEWYYDFSYDNGYDNDNEKYILDWIVATGKGYVSYEYDEDIISIDVENGVITALEEGTTTLKAHYNNTPRSIANYHYYTETTITVDDGVEDPKLTFEPSSYKVRIGSNETQNVTVYLYNYGENPKQDVTTSTSIIYNIDPEKPYAHISTGGAITGITEGDTIIYATFNDNDFKITTSAPLNVYKEDPPPTPPPSSGGSSGSVKTPIGQILVDKKVIEDIYEEDVIAKNNIYTFTADKSGKSAKLWLDSKFYKDLAEDYSNRIIQFNWDNGTYTLPLNCNEVLKEIDNSAKKVNILIEDVDEKKIISFANKSAENMGAEIISNLIDFCVFVEKSNQNTEINSYDFYAVRTINKLDEISENISTAMKFVEDKEYLTFAPSVFNDDYATIKYRGNGIFTIIENPQTFSDISSHWAKLNIEKLATRNIAFGRENNSFSPDDFVTRAEFAVMIARALGITEEEGSNNFTDVSNEWFAEDIGTAFSSGLVNGRNDGKFYPNEKIQRKDMAVMIHNSLKFIGLNTDVSNADTVLSIFNDSNSIADYARESTAVCAKAEIILGRDTGNFDPNDNATRAESSAIIERMLKFVEFMD
jgi:hypothetical protein